MPWKWPSRPGGAVSSAPKPTSGRLEQNLRDYDVDGEQSIALAQGAIAVLLLALHAFARFMSALPIVQLLGHDYPSAAHCKLVPALAARRVESAA